MNRRKVRSVANQSKILETIFNPERTGRNKNKKRNSHRRDGRQEGSICNKQVEGREENGTLELGPHAAGKGLGWEGSMRAATGLLKGSVLNAYVVGRWVLGGQ